MTIKKERGTIEGFNDKIYHFHMFSCFDIAVYVIELNQYYCKKRTHHQNYTNVLKGTRFKYLKTFGRTSDLQMKYILIKTCQFLITYTCNVYKKLDIPFGIAHNPAGIMKWCYLLIVCTAGIHLTGKHCFNSSYFFT